jgi:hypothetical protein
VEKYQINITVSEMNSELELSKIYEAKGYEVVEGESKFGDDVEKNVQPRILVDEVSKPEEIAMPQGNLFGSYLKKFTGVEGKAPPPMQKLSEMVFSSTLAFIGLLLVSITDYYFLYPGFTVDDTGIKMLTGAYGATSGLLLLCVFLTFSLTSVACLTDSFDL